MVALVALLAFAACYSSDHEPAASCTEEASGCGDSMEDAGATRAGRAGSQAGSGSAGATSSDASVAGSGGSGRSTGGAGGTLAMPADAGVPTQDPPAFDPFSPSPLCGNGMIDLGELCDGADFTGPSTCAALFGPEVAGSLRCTSVCTLDTGGCMWAEVDPDAGPDSCSARLEASSPGRAGVYEADCQSCLCEECDGFSLGLCDDRCWDLTACIYSECDGNFDDVPCILDACTDTLPSLPAAGNVSHCMETCSDACLPDLLGGT